MNELSSHLGSSMVPRSQTGVPFCTQHCLQYLELVLSSGQHIRCPPNTQKHDYLVHSTAGYHGLASQTTWLITRCSYALLMSHSGVVCCLHLNGTTALYY